MIIVSPDHHHPQSQRNVCLNRISNQPPIFTGVVRPLRKKNDESRHDKEDVIGSGLTHYQRLRYSGWNENAKEKIRYKTVQFTALCARTQGRMTRKRFPNLEIYYQFFVIFIPRRAQLFFSPRNALSDFVVALVGIWHCPSGRYPSPRLGTFAKFHRSKFLSWLSLNTNLG